MEQVTILSKAPNSPDELKCTVGICAFNEQSNIGLLLHNLLNNQDLGRDAQVLVVCSGCTDSTPDIVRQFSMKDSRIELILQKERMGKASAVNEILKRASNEIIFLIPADVLPSAHSIFTLLEQFSDPTVGAVCGSPTPVNETRSFSGYLSNLVWRMHNRTLKMLSDSNINSHATGEMMAFKRELISDIPDNTINDDAYIALEIAKKFRVKYCEAAKVYMKGPSNLLDYIKQRRRVVYGHHSIKRATKHYPRTLETMLYYDSNRVVKIVREEIGERPLDFPRFMLAIVFELMVNALAFADLLVRKNHVSWSIVSSTKDLSEKQEINIERLPFLHKVKQSDLRRPNLAHSELN